MPYCRLAATIIYSLSQRSKAKQAWICTLCIKHPNSTANFSQGGSGGSRPNL